MGKGMRDAVLLKDPDHDFVVMMIPHHQGAVDMAKLVLMHGKDPNIRQLADEIITSQEADIWVMQMWLKNQKTPGKGSSK
jgi:uncharacterized protein (DUF305 family)